MKTNHNLWAMPQEITDINKCYFYHTMDIPGYGLRKGQWDLRAGIRQYLGNTEFKGKRVFEIGTASGFICFYMEKQGAEVVAYDLSENEAWDVVPYAGYDYEQEITMRKKEIKKLNNSFWLAHKAYKSRAKMVYGTVYNIPEAVGMYDIATLSSILLHLRDPFRALQGVARHTKKMIIITEPFFSPMIVPPLGNLFNTSFLPDAKKMLPKDGWWALSPKMIKKFIAVLGFEKTKTNIHLQKYFGRNKPMFTIVGYRTKKG
jgi:hypothetical protein